MANLKDCVKWNIHDDYFTRKETWSKIKDFIPDKQLWEFCMLNATESKSKENLSDLGFKVMGETNIDFLDHNEQYEKKSEVLISNIPFSSELKQKILRKLVALDKPFIIVMNSLNIFTKYFAEIFKDKEIYFIYPSTKIHYDKYKNGKFVESRNNTSFYSVYVTYKIIDKNIFL
mgnify:CR=1 FL=1